MALVYPKNSNRLALGGLPEYLPAYCGDFDAVIAAVNDLLDGVYTLTDLTLTGTLSVAGTATFTGVIASNLVTDSTSKDTGAVILQGGMGVEKSIFAGLTINSGTTMGVGTALTVGTDIHGVKEVNHIIDVNASTTATVAGGNLVIASGIGATSGNGGLLSLTGGVGGTTGTGGNLNLTSGPGGSASGNSGTVTIASNAETSTDLSGLISIATGTTVSANSGLLNIFSGVVSTLGTSGAVNIGTGASTTSGDSGDLTVSTGNAGGGDSGDINLSTGTGSGAAGRINFKIATVTDFFISANTFTAVAGSTIATDTIAETTATSGVTIDGVLVKDSTVALADGAVGDLSVKIGADANNGMYGVSDTQLGFAVEGTLVGGFNTLGLFTDIIAEQTATVGVTVDGLLIKDGGASANSMFAGFFPTTAAQALSGPGAVNVTAYLTKFTSTGAGDALSIASGSQIGQRKKVVHVVDGGSGVLTGVFVGGTTITFTSVAEFADLIWTGSAWGVLELGNTATPGTPPVLA